MPRKVRLHFWVPCVWCCCCCCCFCGGISLSMKWYCYVSFSGWNAHKYLCSLNLCSIFYCFVAFDFFRSLSLSTSYFINSSEFDSLYSVFSWIWTRAFVFTTLPLTHGCYQWTLLLWVSLYQYCIVALAHSHTHTHTTGEFDWWMSSSFVSNRNVERYLVTFSVCMEYHSICMSVVG